jgi:hypothetical protein
LFAAKDRLAGPAFAAAEERIVAALAAAMAELGVADASEAAQVMLAASAGVANGATEFVSLATRLALLVDAMVRGLTA